MRPTVLILTIALIAAPAPAQRPDRPPHTIRLTVRPAAEPRPALRYQLLPPLLDCTPGNAAQLYYLGIGHMPKRPDAEQSKMMGQWMKVPLAELPADKAAKLIRPYATAIGQFELAARREWCRWDVPVRQQGLSLILPKLGDYRDVAQILALRARTHLAAGRIDDGLRDLQTGMAMARHLGAGPTLIHSLVGVAVAGLLVERVEDVVQMPNGPNMYWALSCLPRPFAELRAPMAHERDILFLSFPELRKARTGQLDAGDWEAITARLANMTGRPGRPEGQWKSKLAATVVAIGLYPQARRYLISQGRPARDVEAMPAVQVVASYSLGSYEYCRDEVFKWFHLPYWQARDGMRRANLAVAAATREQRGNVLLALIPSLGRAYLLTTKVDRRIAALRCVEAVRAHAAAHGGKLPRRLDELTDMPAPIDPVTGKAFQYQTKADTFTLTGPSPADVDPSEGLRYEVKVAR